MDFDFLQSTYSISFYRFFLTSRSVLEKSILKSTEAAIKAGLENFPKFT